MPEFSHDLFQKFPLIGILRGYSKSDTSAIIDTFRTSGLTTLEITLNTTGALEIINEMASRHGGSINIGAGTVCTLNEMDNALEAGACFIVTPVLNTKIVNRCRDLGVPVFPGAFSPTEIYNAWEAGATMVKVFPASKLGADYIKQVKAPLNNIKLMPTGGISLENFDDYIHAGANGFGLGNSLIRDDYITSGNWEALEQNFKKYAAAWASAFNKI